jgi:hypothetical protein
MTGFGKIQARHGSKAEREGCATERCEKEMKVHRGKLDA